jgi:hypothetical protein
MIAPIDSPPVANLRQNFPFLLMVRHISYVCNPSGYGGIERSSKNSLKNGRELATPRLPGMQSDAECVFSALEEQIAPPVWSNRHDKGEFFRGKLAPATAAILALLSIAGRAQVGKGKALRRLLPGGKVL